MPTDDEERYQRHLRDIGGAPDTPEMRRAWEAEDRAGGGQAPGGGGWEDQFRQSRREWEDATHRTGEWDRWNPQQREEEFARHAQGLGYGSRQDLEDYLGGRESTRPEGTYDVLMRQIADSRAARDGGLYQARPGDTLSGIAARFGLSTEDLLRWNPRDDPSLLRVGEIINLPSYGQAPTAPQRPTGLLGRPPEGQQGGRWAEEAIPMPSPLANPAAFARWLAGEKTRRVYQGAPEEAPSPQQSRSAFDWLQRRLGGEPEPPEPHPEDLGATVGDWLERMRQALFPSAEPSLPPEEAARTWEGVTPEQMEQATAGRGLETLLGATEPLGWGFTYGSLPLWRMMLGQAGVAPGMATPEQGIVPEQPFEALTPEEALQRGEQIQEPEFEALGRQWAVPLVGGPAAALDPLNLLLFPGLWRGGAAALRELPGMARGAARGAREVAEELAPGARRLLAEEMGGIGVPPRRSVAEGFREKLNARSILEGGEVDPRNPLTKAAWRSMGPAEFNRLSAGAELGGPGQVGKRGGWFSWYPARASAQEGTRKSPKYLVEFKGVDVVGEATTRPVSIADVSGIWKSEGKGWVEQSVPGIPKAEITPPDIIPQDLSTRLGAIPGPPPSAITPELAQEIAEARRGMPSRRVLEGEVLPPGDPSLYPQTIAEAEDYLRGYQAAQLPEPGSPAQFDPLTGKMAEVLDVFMPVEGGYVPNLLLFIQRAAARKGLNQEEYFAALKVFNRELLTGASLPDAFKAFLEAVPAAKRGVGGAVLPGQALAEVAPPGGGIVPEVGYVPQIPVDRAQEVISQAERGVINRGGGKLLPAMQRWAASEGLSDSEYVQRLSQAESALALGKNLDEIAEAFKRQPFLQLPEEQARLAQEESARLRAAGLSTPESLAEEIAQAQQGAPPLPGGVLSERAIPGAQRLSPEELGMVAREGLEALPPSGALPPPPPPGGVGPISGGVVPQGRIVPIPKTSNEYIVDLFTPSWRRQLGLLMGKVPVIRQAVQLANPRLLAEDTIARAKIVADMFTDFGRRAPEIIVAHLEVLGPFPFNLEGGIVRNVVPKRAKASMFLDDIMQWPGRYNLTPEQTKFISTYHQAIDELTRNAEAVGVQINKLPYLVEKRGAHYIPRIPTGFNPDDSVITSMRRMGAEQTFQKPRTFMTKAEGVAAGVEYLDNPIEVLRIHSRQVYNSMRDTEIASILKSRARPVGVEVPMPAFEGLRFAPDDAKAIMGMVDQQIPGLLRGVAGVNSLLKNLRATADFATWLIQLVTLSHHRPVILGKAMSRSVADLVSPVVQKRFLVERFDTVEKLLRNGVPISAEAHFLAQEAGITGATLQHKVPLLGPLYKRFESTFGTALTDAAIYTWEALEPTFKRSGRPNWEAELGAHIRNGLGMGMYAGMGQKQRAIEASLGFAMSYYRSFMGLLLDLTRGGTRGAEARWMLSKLAAGATLGYAGLSAATGQAPRLDPRKGNFFTFDVGEGKDKTRIKYPFMQGMFGSLMRTLGSVVAYAGLEPAEIIEPLPGQEVDMERLLRADVSNPLYRWALGHRAPGLGVVTDLIIGKTYLGDPLRAWEDVAKYLGSQFVPFAFGDLFLPSQDVTGEEVGIQTLGLQMYPVSPAERRNQLREAYATQEFGVPWSQLSSGRREHLINANQDLAEVTQEAVVKWLRQADPVIADRFNRTEEYWDSYNAIIEDFRQRRQAIPIGQQYDEQKAYQEQTKTINDLKQRLGLTDDDLFGERPPFPRGPSLLDLGRYLINLFQKQLPPVAQGQPHEEFTARALAQSPDMLQAWLKGLPIGIPPGEVSISTKDYIIIGRSQEEFNANERQLFPTLSRVYGALYDAARDPNGIFDAQRFLVLQQEFLRNVPDPLESRWQEWRERNKTPGDMVRDIYGEYVAQYYADNEGKTSQERQQWVAQNPPPAASFIAATALNRWGHRFTQDVNEVDHPNKWHWNDLSEALEGLNIPNIDEYFERRSAQRIKELQETGQPFYASSGVLVKQNNLDEYLLGQQQLDEYMNWLETVWRPAAGLRSQRDALTARIDRLYDERNAVLDNPDVTLEERQKAFTEAKEQVDTFKEQRELIRNRLPTYQNAPALVIKYFFGPPDAEERERLKQLPPEVRAQMVEQEAVPRGGFGGPEPRSVTVAKIFETMPTADKGATSEEISAWWDTNEPRLKELGWRQEPFKEEIGRMFDTMPDFGEKPTKEQRAILSQWWDDNKPRLLELGWTPKWESQIQELAREWWDKRRQRGERTGDIDALATHLEGIGMGDKESLKVYMVGPGANDLEKGYIWSEYYGLQAAGKKDEASQYFRAKKSRLKELGWETTPEQDEIDRIFEEYNTRKATNKKDAYNWLESMKPRLAELGFEFKNGEQPTTTTVTWPGEIANTANVEWWDALTTEGTPEWRREFEEVHNRPPNNIDYFRDYLWSLDFQRSKGRGPSRAEWGQHYWEDVRRGRPRTRTPEFAPAGNGNRTLTNAQWSNVQTLLGRTGTNELIGSRFVPGSMSEGTRRELQRYYREHPYGARSFEDWLAMSRRAFQREMGRD